VTMLKSILAAAAIAGTVILPARAQVPERILEVATKPNVVCFSRGDMVDVIKAGQLQRGETFAADADHLAETIRSKIDAGRCLALPEGQMAYLFPNELDRADLAGGLAWMRGARTGTKFYTSIIAGWQAAQ
jgi:hypothetical protein